MTDELLKIIHEIERVGDKAERVAEMAIQLAGVESKFPHHELEHMAELVKGMLHDALDAFARMTVEDVPAITERDDNVDREYDNILRQLITRMMEDPRNITRTQKRYRNTGTGTAKKSIYSLIDLREILFVCTPTAFS